MVIMQGRAVVYDCHMVSCFVFKQKTAYEMRISDWSSDVCSSDLVCPVSAAHFFIVSSWRSVSMMCGITAFMRMPLRAYCVASVLDRLSTAALLRFTGIVVTCG